MPTPPPALPDVISTLGRYGAMVRGDGATHRFAGAAGYTLGQREVGTEAALSRLVLAAIRNARSDDAAEISGLRVVVAEMNRCTSRCTTS
jgi:hypothetical protein